MPSKPSYYEILELKPDASPHDIDNAKRKLSLKIHPDKHMNAPAHVIEANLKALHLINEAHETLSDKSKRKKYDATNGIKASHRTEKKSETDQEYIDRIAKEYEERFEHFMKRSEESIERFAKRYVPSDFCLAELSAFVVSFPIWYTGTYVFACNQVATVTSPLMVAVAASDYAIRKYTHSSQGLFYTLLKAHEVGYTNSKNYVIIEFFYVADSCKDKALKIVKATPAKVKEVGGFISNTWNKVPTIFQSILSASVVISRPVVEYTDAISPKLTGMLMFTTFSADFIIRIASNHTTSLIPTLATSTYSLFKDATNKVINTLPCKKASPPRPGV